MIRLSKISFMMGLLLTLCGEVRSETQLARPDVLGDAEVIATIKGAMPTGITVADSGRIFINYPRWGDNVIYTVAEVIDGIPVPYPNRAINNYKAGKDPSKHLVAAQSVVVDPSGQKLWVLDTGSVESNPVGFGGPKLVAINLSTNQVVQTILFAQDVATPTTYLNDVRFDLSRGESGIAFITDSSAEGGLIVVDLASGKSRRRLTGHASVMSDPTFVPLVEGQALKLRQVDEESKPFRVGSDGIAISPDGETLYYRSLTSRHLYSIPVDDLIDQSIRDQDLALKIRDYGQISGASDGLESDSKGRIYLTDYEHNAIHRLYPGEDLETLMVDPRALWPDTLSLANDGYLYFTANQLHRRAIFHQGIDKRVEPYGLLRIKVNAKPIRF